MLEGSQDAVTTIHALIVENLIREIEIQITEIRSMIRGKFSAN